MQKTLIVRDNKEDKFLFLKEYDSEEAFFEDLVKVQALYYAVEEDRYEIIEESDSIDDLLEIYPKWKESIDEHGMPDNDLFGWQEALKRLAELQDRQTHDSSG